MRPRLLLLLRSYLPTLLSLPPSRTITNPNPDSDDALVLFLICFRLVIVVEYTSAGARLVFLSFAVWDGVTAWYGSRLPLW